MRTSNALVVLCVGIVLCLGGCESWHRTKTLSEVAKDWCEMMRASQLICAYPLTEDLQVGDVFLVVTPIQEQHDEYKEKGFLRLDQMATRLDGLDFKTFYQSAYWDGSFADIAHGRTECVGVNCTQQASTNATRHWIEGLHVPLTAFPTYSFTINTSSGFACAIPINGIPLGLNLLHADKATGSVAISESFTVGLPGDHLVAKLYAWANQGGVKSELGRMAQVAAEPLYLRVVSRVYYAGKVNVSLVKTDELSAGGNFGADKGLNLMAVADDKSEQTYLDKVNSMVAATKETLPGVEIKYAHATNSSVVFVESFPRPLAVGYLGFDVRIYKDGSLGPPISTRQVLEYGADDPYPNVAHSAHYNMMYDQVRGMDPAVRTKVIASMADYLPKEKFGQYALPKNVDEIDEQEAFWDELDLYVKNDPDNAKKKNLEKVIRSAYLIHLKKEK